MTKSYTTDEEIRRSILECRRIYSNMTDDAFVVWYRRRYKVDRATIYKTLKGVST